MSYETMAGQVGKTADLELAGLTTQLNILRDANSTLSVALTTANAQYLALKGKYEALLPAPKYGTSAESVAKLDVRDTVYGKGKVARVFYPSIPKVYDGPVDRQVIVSFKCSLTDLVAGKLDSALILFLRSLPANSIVALYHEPEDNIEQGKFTAAQFRAAQAYVKKAITTNGLKLKFALILMGWTLNPASGRNFSDYFTAGLYDYLGWDCYNLNKTGYSHPADVFGKVLEKSVTMSLPPIICEWGSTVKSGDDGTARGAWITACGEYLREAGVTYVAWFDRLMSDSGNDYRLTDGPSKKAFSALLV